MIKALGRPEQIPGIFRVGGCPAGAQYGRSMLMVQLPCTRLMIVSTAVALGCGRFAGCGGTFESGAMTAYFAVQNRTQPRDASTALMSAIEL